ncbi:amidase [Serratia ficaria]|uniref:amidase n=1 Tax=Serratia ficaria TaxID=61651 RepID=UPI00217B23FA|nr:amidase [Serratia ficaria]CAI1092730.1 Mandelamide hydrolase [Serratia ficaria]CAI1193227.1 Mandelamide hydrolase [Serratia ficaria]CAI1988121.1 Mandelamide hydrolase [Serratia ficaria]CAI2495166.1 Mandelamide hydrolase [Serratia ficaria]CAI2519048.1 Mandelamide hydrolase [Serratia ficaria]
MNKLTLEQAAAALAKGELTAVQLTAAALAQIADERGEGVRAFTQVYGEWAQRQAQAADRRRAEGKPLSALDGVPVSVKDLFDVAGQTTAAGSRVLAAAPKAERHAAIVERLLQAGAVVIGKTGMTEFAYSGLGINPHYGTPANPWDRAARRIPGGSSSGAAVAVADGMCLGSIGSDTGGSVRIPAAFCGLTGFKPTARRINDGGLLPLSPSLDSIGVIAHRVADCIALDALIAGGPLRPQPKTLEQARFAVPQTLVLDELQPQVAEAFQQALRRLAQAGAQIEPIPLAELAELAAINAAGGFTALESWRWHRALIAERADDYDPRVLSRIRRGQPLGEQDLQQLRQQRADWQQRVAAAVQGFDALLMPTAPLVAPTVAELEASEEAYFRCNALALRNPSIINFLDGCALSLPCQRPGAAPIGLMLAGLPMRDEALLGWALAVERCLAGA